MDGWMEAGRSLAVATIRPAKVTENDTKMLEARDRYERRTRLRSHASLIL
jgi:hypothetical protein